VDRIERATELKAGAPLRPPALMKPEIAGWVGKKLWGERHRTSGKPHAMEEPPGHRFARGDFFLVMEKQSRVEPLDAASPFDNRRDDPSMVPAFNTDGFHP
jgi:hypothetical protein